MQDKFKEKWIIIQPWWLGSLGRQSVINTDGQRKRWIESSLGTLYRLWSCSMIFNSIERISLSEPWDVKGVS